MSKLQKIADQKLTPEDFDREVEFSFTAKSKKGHLIIENQENVGSVWLYLNGLRSKVMVPINMSHVCASHKVEFLKGEKYTLIAGSAFQEDRQGVTKPSFLTVSVYWEEE